VSSENGEVGELKCTIGKEEWHCATFTEHHCQCQAIAALYDDTLVLGVTGVSLVLAYSVRAGIINQ
jgi:hypothetical protein